MENSQMTNFEKWKQSLKIEDFDCENPVFELRPSHCATCPIQDQCNDMDISCNQELVNWFKKEAQ